jgi:hypothetical protein
MGSGDHSANTNTARGGPREEAPTSRRGGRMLRPMLTRRSAVAGAMALLCLAGTAAAAGGLSVGSILPGDETPPEYRQTDETVVALGTDPRVGQWRVVTYRSPELVDRGEVVQPAGLPCLKLALFDDTTDELLATRSYCGERGKGGLAGASLPVRDSAGRVFTLLFGKAPEQAAGIRLRDSNRKNESADLYDGPRSVDGDFWVHVTPRGNRAEQTWIEWTGSDGEPRGERVDLSLELRQPLDPVPSGGDRS